MNNNRRQITSYVQLYFTNLNKLPTMSDLQMIMSKAALNVNFDIETNCEYQEIISGIVQSAMYCIKSKPSWADALGHMFVELIGQQELFNTLMESGDFIDLPNYKKVLSYCADGYVIALFINNLTLQYFGGATPGCLEIAEFKKRLGNALIAAPSNWNRHKVIVQIMVQALMLEKKRNGNYKKIAAEIFSSLYEIDHASQEILHGMRMANRQEQVMLSVLQNIALNVFYQKSYTID